MTILAAASVATIMASLAAQSAMIQRTDEEIGGHQVLIETLRLKTEPLHAQIADLQASEPAVDGPDTAQIDALVRSPGSVVDLQAISERVHAARVEADTANMAIATVQAAIDRIEAEISEAEAKIAVLRVRRESEFREFAVAIQFNLAPLFEKEFVRLRDEVMLPLLAVSKLRTSDGRTDLLSVRDPGAAKFSWDTVVTIERFQGNFTAPMSNGKWEPQKLFDTKGVTASSAEQIIQKFREFLASVAREEPT